MNDGCDHNFVSVQLVDNAVAVDYDLTDVLVVELRDFAASLGKAH